MIQELVQTSNDIALYSQWATWFKDQADEQYIFVCREYSFLYLNDGCHFVQNIFKDH